MLPSKVAVSKLLLCSHTGDRAGWLLVVLKKEKKKKKKKKKKKSMQMRGAG